MIEITDKANKYAEMKSNDVMTKVIAQAYADGYRDGYKDCQEELSVNLRDNNTEYIDLGLPSGTLWSTDYETVNNEIMYESYESASKFMIPTREQVEELFNCCEWELHRGSRDKYTFLCIGRDNFISFDFSGYKIPEPINGVKERYWHACFWVLSQKDSYEKDIVSFSIKNDTLNRRIILKELKKQIPVRMLPIRLVKTK